MAHRLQTQADGRRYAIHVLEQLYNVGREKCRADRPGKSPPQHGGLILALLDVHRNGTASALVGFACILTDRIGARLYGVEQWDYRDLERCGKFRKWKRGPDARQGRAGTLTQAPECDDRQEGRLRG